MALKMRLARAGRKQSPFYRIVVADARSPRDGKFIAKVGTYNPLLSKDNDQRIVLNTDLIKKWLLEGAQPSERVARFLGEAGLIEMPKNRTSIQKAIPKEKAQERVREKEEKLVAKKEAEEAAKAEAKAAAEEAPAVEAETTEAPAEEVTAEEAPAAEAEKAE